MSGKIGGGVDSQRQFDVGSSTIIQASLGGRQHTNCGGWAHETTLVGCSIYSSQYHSPTVSVHSQDRVIPFVQELYTVAGTDWGNFTKTCVEISSNTALGGKPETKPNFLQTPNKIKRGGVGRLNGDACSKWIELQKIIVTVQESRSRYLCGHIGRHGSVRCSKRGGPRKPAFWRNYTETCVDRVWIQAI